MNLLVIEQCSEFGGVQQNLLEFLSTLRNGGWTIEIGHPGNAALEARAHHLQIPTHRVAYVPGRPAAALWTVATPLLAWQIRRLALRSRADILYVNSAHLLPACAMAELHLPLLFHCPAYMGPGALRTLAGTALGRMEAWVAGPCEFVAAPWREFVPESRVSVIHDGVPGPDGHPRPSASGPPHVGCIGRISPEKGQHYFVAAAARIHEKLPACRFTIYGSPRRNNRDAAVYDSEIRADAAGLPVNFAGWVDDVYSCLAELDLLLAPSNGYESSTRVILEAFASGVPVIAFPSGGIPEIVKSGVNGLLTRDVDDMARRAVELLTGDARRLIHMAHTARATWLRRFRPEQNHRQILHLLETMTPVNT